MNDYSKIKTSSHKYRIHDPVNQNLIGKSLDECGAGRSIVIDAENNIIAGNTVFEQAKKRNIPLKIIETTGDELIAVKRKDLKTENIKRKKLAVLDNSTSDNARDDEELMQKHFTVPKLEEYGVTIIKLENADAFFNDDSEDEKQSKKNNKNTKKTVVCPYCGKEFEP